ncbi:hypothetical protein RvY_09161 [Ramazzottius varieornatus]|uniref:Ubinuclein middle domain-containing protein n=1 Tax=Ramazzottius varieornatus TaxID=947166 RepID=A0A1D1VGB4_RAMVA|nr:hypothetical protein RvY_09161 [Ramazzottius varieornatus]
MAEPRRISLISSTLPVMREPVATTSAAAAPSPKSEDVQFISLSFDVVQPTEDTLPAYDFAEQIYAAQKEIDEDNKDDKKPSSVPFDVDDEEKLTDMAKHFETKYGSKPRDFRDFGAGYDQNDSFVDDTSVVEKEIPSGWTTQHGGFYIGTGPLLVRPLQPEEEKTHVYQSATVEQCLAALKSFSALGFKKRRVLESSDDESSPSTLKAVSKKKELAVISDDEAEPVLKPRKSIAAGEKPPKAHSKAVSEVGTKKTSSKTVASILARRGDNIEEKEMPTDLRVQKADKIPKEKEVGGKAAATKKADKDAIGEAKSPGVVVPLPDEVPESTRSVIEALKNLADTWEGGKCNFFSPEQNPAINGLLLELEHQCRQFRCGLRSTVFSHMANHLPCSKETLVKRARKLRQDDVDAKFRKLLKKLGSVLMSDDRNGFDAETMQLRAPIRKLIVEAVRLNMSVHDLYRTKYPTHEDFIRHMVEADLLPVWRDKPIEKEHVLTEAIMALADALRPRSHLSGSTASPDSEPDVEDPGQLSVPNQKLVQPVGKASKPASKTHRNSMPAPSLFSNKDSDVKVQYTTKTALLKEPGRSSTPNYSNGVQPDSLPGKSCRPVFVPDVTASSSRKSQENPNVLPKPIGRPVASKSRSSTPNSASTSTTNKRPSSKSSIASLEDSNQSGRASISSSKTTSSKRTHSGSRQGDYAPSGDPRVLEYRQSPSASTVEEREPSTKAYKGSRSSKSKPSSQSPVSASPFLGPAHSHTSPFLPYNNPSLMVGQFTPESLFAMGLHPGYTNPFADSYASALMQNAGVFSTGGLDLGRPAQSASTLRTSSRTGTHDSAFNPR